MSNFRFLAAEWPSIAFDAMEAEKYALSGPIPSAVYARRALERTIRWMYENDGDLEYPYDRNLSALLHAASFTSTVPPSIARELHYIRKVGNDAAHDKRIYDKQSVATLQYLFRFLKWFGRTYSELDPEIGAFNETFLTASVKAKEIPSVSALNTLQEQYDAQQKKYEAEQEIRLKAESEREALKAELATIKARKTERAALPIPASPYSEAETRLLFIDELLREAGWDPEGANVPEYPVTGMPKATNPNGNGFVDYVLWGANGKPLAVLEAKKTLVNAENGKIQASLYADCLEQMTGQRPVIFYSNGLDTWIWDDRFHTPRKVHGIYTQEELQRMVDRRTTRKDIRTEPIDQRIVGRYYQQDAIRRVAEEWVSEHNGELVGKKRRALVVMATGAGKTRTAAAFVDVLLKANWAKRVLFLADRITLVSQAQEAFREHLPQLSTVNLSKERYDPAARVVFSTYPSMLNRIDQSRSDDLRTFGVGHFDLIIVDEAHRSVYDRYENIFTYFDAHLLGLTATPRSETDRDTYELFECEEHNPTSFYELDQAVKDGFLVPPIGVPLQLGFMQRGIRYEELDASDQERYERTFRDESGEMPDEVGAPAINKWLFNASTIDLALKYLMEHGIKVEGGEKIGKTIIFARNIAHARAIQVQFDKHFPHLRGQFLSLVHNDERYSEDTIKKFKITNQLPQICVSVDMLDTGVDIPDVVNLVFFKPVYSKAKFWQMIGRGTRLRPNLFGPGQHKENFRIFDLCDNYAFFDETPDGRTSAPQRSLSALLFETSIELSEQLRDTAYANDEHQALRIALLNDTHSWVERLWERRTTVMIRPVKGLVDSYRTRESWNALTPQGKSDLILQLGPVIDVPDQDELAKRFDLLIRRIQLANVEGSPSVDRLFGQLGGTAAQLARMSNIPVVQQRMASIRAVIDAVESKQPTSEILGLTALETIRTQLRDLVHLIQKEEQRVVYTDLKDHIVAEGRERHDVPGGYAMKGYRERITAFIREHKHHITIHKLHTDQPITPAELEELERLIFDGDERGTKELLMEELGGPQPIGAFIRSIIGLDSTAANQAFADLLSKAPLHPDQTEFIKSIIAHLTKNGIIDKRMLADRPFTDINDQGLFGVFPQEDDQDRIISIIDRVNRNAEPAVGA